MNGFLTKKYMDALIELGFDLDKYYEDNCDFYYYSKVVTRNLTSDEIQECIEEGDLEFAYSKVIVSEKIYMNDIDIPLKKNTKNIEYYKTLSTNDLFMILKMYFKTNYNIYLKKYPGYGHYIDEIEFDNYNGKEIYKSSKIKSSIEGELTNFIVFILKEKKNLFDMN